MPRNLDRLDHLDALARALASIETRVEWFAPRLDGASRDDEADFWCAVIAIGQRASTARAEWSTASRCAAATGS